MAVAFALVAALGAGCSSDGAVVADDATDSTLSPSEHAACESTGDTIDIALRAYELDTGELPSSLGALASEQFLTHDPSDEWTYTTEGGTFTLTGACGQWPRDDDTATTTSSG